MTYIELINDFWQKDIEYAFSDKEIALYFYLLKTCNSIGWKNPFGLSNSITAVKFNWGKQAFDTAKLNLQKAGLIDFKGSHGRGKVYQYEIKGIQTDQFSPTFSQPFSTTFSDQKAETSLDIDKIRNNNYNERHVVFVIPSVTEIEEYCLARVNGINAAQFFDYYQSKGWCVGKGRMKDWRAAIRTWERNVKKNIDYGQKITKDNQRIDDSARRKAEIVERAVRAAAECDIGG